jgi:hypothetical protein
MMTLYASGSVRWQVCVPVLPPNFLCSESVCWLVYALANKFPNESVLPRISSLTSLWFSKSGRWRVYASANPFAHELALQQIRSLTSWRCSESVRWWLSILVDQFADEYVSPVLPMNWFGCSESVPWQVFTSANQFPHKSVLQRIPSLTSMCFRESVHYKFALQWISLLMTLFFSGIRSLTRLRWSESVLWWVCVVANEFADDSTFQRNQFAYEVVWWSE